MTQQRSRTPEPPYCWQSKVARRMICEYFDGDAFGASCLGVYAALTEIASDEEAETFTTQQSYIAQKSCLGATTVKKALKELRSLGLVAYETPRLRKPITFTLVATRPTLDKCDSRHATTVEEHIVEEERAADAAVSFSTSVEKKKPASSVGKKPAGRKIVVPTREEFLEYARSKEISDLDGSQLFEEWSTADWVNGNGTPIISWQRTLLVWKNRKWLPSHKRAQYRGSAQSKPKGPHRI